MKYPNSSRSRCGECQKWTVHYDGVCNVCYRKRLPSSRGADLSDAEERMVDDYLSRPGTHDNYHGDSDRDDI